MNISAVTNGINSLLSLAILFFVLFKKPRSAINFTYISWLIFLFLWTSLYYLWGIEQNKEKALFWISWLIYSISFIHVTHFHFALALTDSIKKYLPLLVVAYASSAYLVFLNYNGLISNFDLIRQKGVFKYWPVAGSHLWVFIAIQVFFAILGIYVMCKRIRQVAEPKKSRLRLFILFASVAWMGAAS